MVVVAGYRGGPGGGDRGGWGGGAQYTGGWGSGGADAHGPYQQQQQYQQPQHLLRKVLHMLALMAHFKMLRQRSTGTYY